MITHGACGQSWTGLRRAHCPSCHITFNSDSASVGLVAVEKPYGTLWQSPAPEGGYTFHATSEQDDAAVHEETVRAFNAAHPVGTPVIAYPGCRPEDHPGDPRLVTTTRSPAQVLEGHTPVVWVDGHDACIALTHIDVTEGAGA